MSISFSHYSGCGNDFIIIDDRTETFDANPILIRTLCIEAGKVDGLILVQNSKAQNSQHAAFKMRIFNNDGFEASMCGNGVRALARFVKEKLNYLNTSYLLETMHRTLHIQVQDDLFCVDMGKVVELGFEIDLTFDNRDFRFCHLDTGVPHLVTFVDDLETIDVVKVGRHFRHHAHFLPKGANVNFVDAHTQKIRTYERGVEDETLACGTGATAAAFALVTCLNKKAPIRLQVRSGEFLEFEFTTSGSSIMKGPATHIKDGKFNLDELYRHEDQILRVF